MEIEGRIATVHGKRFRGLLDHGFDQVAGEQQAALSILCTAIRAGYFQNPWRCLRHTYRLEQLQRGTMNALHVSVAQRPETDCRRGARVHRNRVAIIGVLIQPRPASAASPG